MITTPPLCTREDVMRAVDIKLTARMHAQVDRAIEAATGAVEGLLHRTFHPWTGTKYFPWPGTQYAAPWILRLGQHEVVSVTRLEAGGTVIPASAYFLEPNGSGPPYTRIEIDLASSSAFSAGDTNQRAIAVTGTFGYSATTSPVGLLDGTVTDTQTTVTVTDSATVGVGDVLLADDERLLVVGKTMTDTGVTLAGAAAASNGDVVLQVSTSSGAPAEDETILVDGERMLVVDVAGTALVVKRAWDGSTLAAHDAGTPVYAPRALTVQRGVGGTTAAAHFDDTPIARHVVPGLVRQLAVAEAISQGVQEGAGWARDAGTGDAEKEILQRGIGQLRDQAYAAYGRKARTRAV